MGPSEVAIAKHVARRFIKRRRLWNYELEDAESDALMAVWKATLSFDGRGNRSTYLYIKAEQGVVDGIRQQCGRLGSARNELYKRMFRAGNGDPDEGSSRERSEMEFEAFVAELADGDDERVRFILHRLAEGYSKREIAEQLGVDPSRVSQLLKQVKERVELGLVAA